MTIEPRWRRLLRELYGESKAIAARFEAVLARHRADGPGTVGWSEDDAWLITYPHQFQRASETPLRTVAEFYATHLADALNGVHILPFFPWTSDDGYSITDYTAVDPAYGTWDDIDVIAAEARVMVDAVINHMSAESEWFERWRSGDPAFRDFFRTAAPDTDVSNVVRAREHPLLTPFETARGDEWVWTTFSADQVDLDYRNPEVLARVVEVLLEYASHGVAMIRLDAVCFIWKDEAGPSIHLPQTHAVVQFLRACLDVTYPTVGLISETNVPHAENVSYLGDGNVAEAQAVYQFTLPPLVLHSYMTGDATALASWASRLDAPPRGTTFLNFLASHDGVGLRPLEGILDTPDIDRLAAAARVHGGLVNSRRLADGRSSPYELNATWYDLIRGDTEGDDALARHLGSHAIMLAMRGIPAIYVHSLFAGENDVAAVRATGVARAVNRRKYDPVETLEAELADRAHRSARSLDAFKALLAVRRSHPAFHPDAAQRVVETPPNLFGVERSTGSGNTARVYVNVSGRSATITEPAPIRHGHRAERRGDQIDIGPWGMVWITS